MKQRILTGVVGGAAFLSVIWLGGYWYFFMIYLLATGAYFEYIRMKKSDWLVPSGIIGYFLLLAVLSMGYWDVGIPFIYQLWIALFILMMVTVISKNHLTIEDVSYHMVGAVYIGLGFHYMLTVRIEGGLEWLLLAISCVWATDTGAYFSGRFMGRHKIWPSISPNKTIEGAIGGTLLSVIIAILFYLYGSSVEQLYHAVIIGIIVAIVAQMGDFIESAIKRHFNVKDSGQILPGHGGFFDRFDSMIAVFPAYYILIAWL